MLTVKSYLEPTQLNFNEYMNKAKLMLRYMTAVGLIGLYEWELSAAKKDEEIVQNK